MSAHRALSVTAQLLGICFFCEIFRNEKCFVHKLAARLLGTLLGLHQAL